MNKSTPFVKLDDLIARSEAGEEFTIRVLPDLAGPFDYDGAVLGDTHVADCPMCDAGYEPTRSPTGRNEFASPEMQRWRDALDKYHDGNAEIIRLFEEMRKQREVEAAEAMKPLLDMHIPHPILLAADFAALEERILHHELVRHRAMDVPVVVYIGDTGRARRSSGILLRDGPGLGKSLHDLSYDRIPEPEVKEFFMEPKKRGKDFVGRHGEMPIPSAKRKKFKPSRNASKGRRK
jgi:hypothetical protein